MRNVIYVLAVLGCIAVARAEAGTGTNTDRPRSIHAAHVIKQSWLRELNSGSNALVLGTNAVALVVSPDIKEGQYGGIPQSPPEGLRRTMD